MKRAIPAALLLAAASPAAAQELRIGFINTTTGGGAVIGRHMEAGWKLGLEQNGWTKDGDKLGGVPTWMFYADDQIKPDVARAEVEKMIKSHRANIVAGFIWSNTLAAALPVIYDAKALALVTNAGPAPQAGDLCHPMYVSTSFQNDQNGEATGELLNRDGIKNVVAMAPNYQAGKEYLQAFERTFKGKISDSMLYKLGESDFQAEMSKLRAQKPEAVYIFAPGPMGIAFMKQWQAAGLGKDIKLYTVFSIDYANIAAIGDAAIGTFQTNHWNPTLDNPRNQKFVKDYIAKYNHHPSMFSAQNFDAVNLIADTMKRVGGKTNDMAAVAKAMRQGGLASVRGDLKYNVNGFLIQPFWKREVVKGPDGKPFIVGREKITERPDTHGAKCPADKRI